MSPRVVLRPEGVPEPPGWSAGVSAGGWTWTAGATATDFATGIAPEARPDAGNPYADEPLELQARHLLGTLDRTLRAAGRDLARDVIRVWHWAPAPYPDAAAYAEGPLHWPSPPSVTPYQHALVDGGYADPLRASTGILVRELAIPDARFCVEALAVSEPKQALPVPDGYPGTAVKSYSAATRSGDWVFLAGFGATDFRGDWMGERHMGEPSMVAPEARVNPYIWLGSEIEAQTEYTLGWLDEIARAAGTSLERAVKADVTIGHPSDYAGMDRVWRRWFGDGGPARTVTPGARLVIKGTRVEIALVLLAGDAELRIERVEAPSRLAGLAGEPQAVRAGDVVFLSTCVPIAARGGVPAELRPQPGLPHFSQPARRQAHALLEHVDAVCRAAGTSLDQVCAVRCVLGDVRRLPEVLDEWRLAFPHDPPALTPIGVWGEPLLAPDVELLLDVVAYAEPTGGLTR